VYSYLAYGLGIKSTLLLPEFVAAEAGCDVSIRVESGDRVTAEAEDLPWFFSVTPEHAVLYFHGVGTFLVRGGREITVFPEPDVDERLLRIYIVGTVMGVTLYQKGLLVLHASVADIDGGAVAFLGATEAGKSSMVAALHAQGHRFITDDLAALRLEGSGADLAPAFPQLKLSSEVAAVLGYSEESLIFLHPRESKYGYRVTRGFSPDRVPLRCIYALSGNTTLVAERLGLQQAVVELVRHSFPTRMLQSGGAPHLRQCASLAKTVPVYRLSRPLDLETLPGVVRFVEGHVGELKEQLVV
jgi:hypothetical protein